MTPSAGTPYPARLITLGVGTLGTTPGPTLAQTLADLSPRPVAVVAAVVDRMLVTPRWHPRQVDRWCAELAIPPQRWPHQCLTAPFTLYPDAPNAVHRLAACASVVTVSNSIAPHAHHHTTVARGCPGLAALYTSYLLERAKPDPHIFRLVAARHGAAPAEVIHIGDTWRHDVLGALAAGTAAIWIAHGRPVPDLALVEAGRIAVADTISHAADLLIPPPTRTGLTPPSQTPRPPTPDTRRSP